MVSLVVSVIEIYVTSDSKVLVIVVRVCDINNMTDLHTQRYVDVGGARC